MTGRRVLVTGALGLIGRALTSKLLAIGDEVVAVVRPGSELAAKPGLTWVTSDLRQSPQPQLDTIGSVDAVVHLAQAPGWHEFPRAASEVAAVNVMATINLVQAALKAGATRFVYASSGGIYGPSVAPIDEGAPLKPAVGLGYYLTTKIAAEQMLGYFVGNLSILVLRPFFVFGPGQKAAFVIPRLIKSVIDGAPIRLAAGRGPRLNPIFVEDAASAFAAALSVEGSRTLNIAGPEIVSLKDIAETIGQIVNRTPIFETINNEPEDYVADVSLMKKVLGAGATNVADGLTAVIKSSMAASCLGA